ncbi:MAG: ribonuclease HII [Candidatus Thermoplasmatota archaeon]|nr:ribonuclease HII [Candidatus Thermoplasmatota archaeon]
MTIICGIDEAGRGPVIGPIVIAGIALDDRDIDKLTALGVKDSKRHTPAKREKLAEDIKKIANYEIIVITAQELNIKMEFATLNDLEVNCFAEIIKRLKPEIAYVDSVDVNEERFATQLLSKLDFNLNIISKHKADELYIIVSGASILAKVIRDNEIKKIEQELNTVIGSGYPSDRRTIEFVTRLLKDKKESPYIRKFWKTVKRLSSK